jgi:large subunit ribosomal protein L25
LGGQGKEDNSLEQINLNVRVRKTTGNSPARSLRREGRIPAVLYGPKTEPILLSIDSREFEQIAQKSTIGSVLLNLQIQNGQTESRPAMVKELQAHPVTQKFLHVDFYEVDMQRKIKVMVPVVVRGKAKGAEDGGMLEIIRREIEVLCLPTEIPEAFEVDVTDLNIGDAIHIGDIQHGDNIEIPADAKVTIVTVVAPKVEVEAVEVPEEGVEEAEAEGAAEEAPAKETSAEKTKEA